MQGRGRFARTTLLVAQHHDVSRARLTLTSLQQHASTPFRYLQITRERGQVKCASAVSNRCPSCLNDESSRTGCAKALASVLRVRKPTRVAGLGSRLGLAARPPAW